MEAGKLELLKQMAAGIAAQFGSNCEVVIHDLSADHAGALHRRTLKTATSPAGRWETGRPMW